MRFFIFLLFLSAGPVNAADSNHPISEDFSDPAFIRQMILGNNFHCPPGRVVRSGPKPGSNAEKIWCTIYGRIKDGPAATYSDASQKYPSWTGNYRYGLTDGTWVVWNGDKRFMEGESFLGVEVVTVRKGVRLHEKGSIEKRGRRVLPFAVVFWILAVVCILFAKKKDS